MYLDAYEVSFPLEESNARPSAYHLNQGQQMIEGMPHLLHMTTDGRSVSPNFYNVAGQNIEACNQDLYFCISLSDCKESWEEFKFTDTT